MIIGYFLLWYLDLGEAQPVCAASFQLLVTLQQQDTDWPVCYWDYEIQFGAQVAWENLMCDKQVAIISADKPASQQNITTNTDTWVFTSFKEILPQHQLEELQLAIMTNFYSYWVFLSLYDAGFCYADIYWIIYW